MLVAHPYMEQRYSETEKEALAIVWPAEHVHTYVLVWQLIHSVHRSQTSQIDKRSKPFLHLKSTTL